MSNQSLPAAVLWDLDGTLIDSEQYWMRAEGAIAARYNGEWSHEDGASMIGLALPVSCKIMADRLGITDLTIDEIIAELTNNVLLDLLREIPWRPGALELLRGLNEVGVPQALVTMSLRRIALTVAESLDFAPFQVVVAGDDVERGKPHPDAYLKAAEALNLHPSLCVAIEDSLNGLASAEAAGTKAVAIPHLMHIPDAPTRTIWPSLTQVTPNHLGQLFS